MDDKHLLQPCPACDGSGRSGRSGRGGPRWVESPVGVALLVLGSTFGLSVVYLVVGSFLSAGTAGFFEPPGSLGRVFLTTLPFGLAVGLLTWVVVKLDPIIRQVARRAWSALGVEVPALGDRLACPSCQGTGRWARP